MPTDAGKPSAEQLTIRPARSDDIEAMWAIDQLCFEQDIAYTVDLFYYHLIIRDDAAFITLDGDRPVGFVLMSMSRRREGLLVTIDILPKYRRRGLGNRLIRLAESAMHSRGATVMTLQTAVDNDAAIAFYETHGYRRESVLMNYYGNGKDAFLYKKPLR